MVRLICATLLIVLSASAVRASDPDAAWTPPSGAARDQLLRQHVRPEGAGSHRAMVGGYVVRTDVSADFALDAALFLARFEVQFRYLFGGSPQLKKPALCRIYREEADYRKTFDDGSRGYYQNRSRTLFTYLSRKKGETGWADFYRPILLHEATHQLLRAVLGTTRIAVWFDEGLAAYFQGWDVTTSVSANLERLKEVRYRMEDVRAAFLERRLVPLKTLMRIPRERWAPDNFGPVTKLNYGQAAFFMGYLLATRERRALFVRAYRGIQEGRAPSDVLRKHVGGLEKGWHASLEARFGAPPPERED